MIILKKHKYIISKVIEVFSNILGFLAISFIFINLIDSINFDSFGEMGKENIKIFSLYVILILTSLNFLRKIANFFAYKIYELLRDYGDGYIFDITKGDKKLIEKIKEREKNSKIKITINFLFAFIFNVTCSIFATKILPYIFHK